MESSKGESEKSQSIKLNVILSVPPLFYILYPPLEPFCHPPPFRQKGAFLSYRKLCFHTIKKRRLGCALGAGVDGCRSNRASARECAKAHSFYYIYYSSGAIRRSTHCPNFIAADCFFAYCSVTSLHTGKISSKSSRTFRTASHRCRKTPFSKWKYRLL